MSLSPSLVLLMLLLASRVSLWRKFAKRKMLIRPDAQLHANSFFSPVLGTTLLECLGWARNHLDFSIATGR